MINNFNNIKPEIDDSVYIADGATIIGNVEIKENSSIWYNSVVRGDVNKITIGKNSNVQDLCTLHVGENHSLTIGDNVTIGHNVVLHGCTVENNSLIGIGAIVLDGVKIGESSLIAAGSLIPPNKVIPPKSLVMGNPGKIIRQLSDEEVNKLIRSASHYIDIANVYKLIK